MIHEFEIAFQKVDKQNLLLNCESDLKKFCKASGETQYFDNVYETEYDYFVKLSNHFHVIVKRGEKKNSITITKTKFSKPPILKFEHYFTFTKLDNLMEPKNLQKILEKREKRIIQICPYALKEEEKSDLTNKVNETLSKRIGYDDIPGSKLPSTKHIIVIKNLVKDQISMLMQQIKELPPFQVKYASNAKDFCLLIFNSNCDAEVAVNLLEKVGIHSNILHDCIFQYEEFKDEYATYQKPRPSADTSISKRLIINHLKLGENKKKQQ